MTSKGLRIRMCFIYMYIILLVVSGIVLGTLASYVLIRSFGMRHFYDSIQGSIYFLYGPSLFIFLVSSLGWKAVKKKNCTLLKCFSVMLVLLIVSEVIGSIWNFVSIQLLHESALLVFESKFTNITKEHHDGMWDIMQKKLQCCGIHGAFDYKTLNYVPYSCCKQQSSSSGPAFCATLHHVGCLEAVTEDISLHLGVSSVASAVIALLQIPGVFASWCLANRLREEKISGGIMKKSRQKLLFDKKNLHPIEGSPIQETIP